MVIFLIALIGIVLFVLFSLNTPSVNFKKGNLFNTSVFYNKVFWIVFVISSLTILVKFGTDSASDNEISNSQHESISSQNYNPADSSSENNDVNPDMSGDNLNFGQYLSECKLITQVNLLIIKKRLMTNNNVSEGEVRDYVTEGIKQYVPTEYIYDKNLQSYLTIGTGLGSQATPEMLSSLIASGYKKSENDCINSANNFSHIKADIKVYFNPMHFVDWKKAGENYTFDSYNLTSETN